MNMLIKIIGIIFLCAGIMYLLRPNVLKGFLEFFKQGKRLYLAGLLRFVLAIVFLIGARECNLAWVIAAFGVLFMIGGLLIFIIGLEKLKSIIDWWQKQSSLLIRVIGLVALAIGVVIIYSA